MNEGNNFPKIPGKDSKDEVLDKKSSQIHKEIQNLVKENQYNDPDNKNKTLDAKINSWFNFFGLKNNLTKSTNGSVNETNSTVTNKPDAKQPVNIAIAHKKQIDSLTATTNIGKSVSEIKNDNQKTNSTATNKPDAKQPVNTAIPHEKQIHSLTATTNVGQSVSEMKNDKQTTSTIEAESVKATKVELPGEESIAKLETKPIDYKKSTEKILYSNNKTPGYVNFSGNIGTWISKLVKVVEVKTSKSACKSDKKIPVPPCDPCACPTKIEVIQNATPQKAKPVVKAENSTTIKPVQAPKPKPVKPINPKKVPPAKNISTTAVNMKKFKTRGGGGGFKVFLVKLVLSAAAIIGSYKLNVWGTIDQSEVLLNQVKDFLKENFDKPTKEN